MINDITTLNDKHILTNKFINTLVILLLLLSVLLRITSRPSDMAENPFNSLNKLIIYGLGALSFLIICIKGYKANIYILVFVICSLLAIFRFDQWQKDLYLVDRCRWLFYSGVILISGLGTFNLWRKVLVGFLITNLILCIVAPSLYYPGDLYPSYEIENIPSMLVLPAAVLLCLFPKLDSNIRKLVLFSFFLCLMFYIYYARRTGTVTLFLFFLAPFMVSPMNSMKKVLILTSFLLFTVLAGFLYAILVSGDLFTYFIERLDEDSRSFVNILAIEELGLNFNNWIIGLGIQGGYPNPIPFEDSMTRVYIETGVLDVIMDGGLLLWLSMMVMSVVAFYRGYFKSNNQYIRGISYMILVFMLMQYPNPQPGISFYSFSIFSAIGLCFNNDLIGMNDKEIEQIINESN